MPASNAVSNKCELLLQAIGDYVSKSYKYKEGNGRLSLFNGDAGVLLLQSLLYMSTGRECFREAMEKNMSGIVKAAQSTGEIISPTFCNGLAGLGWLFHYLSEIDLIDLGPDNFYKDIDMYLSKCLHWLLKVKNFDLLHGAPGIAIYFLKRKNYPEVEKVINGLYENCEKADGEIRWSYYDQYRYNQWVYNMGLAHGMAGIMYFLKKCLDDNCAPDKCREMLEGSYSFYLKSIQDHDRAGAFFPDLIESTKLRISKHEQTSRLAWCHGDLGILQVLHLLADAGYVNVNAHLVKSMIVRSAARNNLKTSLIEDPNICHGSAGAGIIFHTMFMNTGNDLFRNATETWKHTTISFVDQLYDTSGDYSFCEDGIDLLLKKDATGLLDGITGIGLFLLSVERASSFVPFDREHKWKECLFLC